MNEQEKLLSEYLKELTFYLEENNSKDKLLGEHMSKLSIDRSFKNLDIEFKAKDNSLTIKFIKREN